MSPEQLVLVVLGWSPALIPFIRYVRDERRQARREADDADTLAATQWLEALHRAGIEQAQDFRVALMRARYNRAVHSPGGRHRADKLRPAFALTSA